MGTGPFKLGEWKKGESAELLANPSYRGGAPTLDRVRVQVIPDPNARAAALRAGEVDALVELGAVQPDQALELRADPNIVVREREIALGHYLFFNGTKPPFGDVRLRQAVSLAVDRAGLVRNVMHGYGRLGGSLLSPLAEWVARSDLQPTYDPARATALAQAALGGGRQRVVLLLNSFQMGRYPYKAIGEVMQAQLAPLGLDVEIRVVDNAAYAAALKAGDYNLSFSTQAWPNGDPDFIFRRYLHSQGQVNLERSFGYANPRADQLIDQAFAERDPARRKAAYDELQALAADQVPASPLFYDVLIWATRKGVSGLEMDVN